MHYDRTHPLIALGDVAAIVAFGLIGLVSHEKELTGVAFARAVLPFPVAWLIVGALARALRPRLPIGRLLVLWVLAGVNALAARALIFDRELFTAFFVIALVGNGLFLAGWRVLFGVLAARSGGGPKVQTEGPGT